MTESKKDIFEIYSLSNSEAQNIENIQEHLEHIIKFHKDIQEAIKDAINPEFNLKKSDMIIHLKETLEAIDEGDNHIKETIKGLTSYIESQGITNDSSSEYQWRHNDRHLANDLSSILMQYVEHTKNWDDISDNIKEFKELLEEHWKKASRSRHNKLYDPDHPEKFKEMFSLFFGYHEDMEKDEE